MLPEVFKNKELINQDEMFVMQLLAMSQTAYQTLKLRRLEESKIPTGSKPIKRTVTDSVMRIDLSPPWISFSLINDGAGSVSVAVNEEDTLQMEESMIAVDETFNFDMTYPVIKTLFLKAGAGASASVRIYGKQGRQI